MEKCPTCRKFWETTWSGSEYCPMCGQTKEQALQRVARVEVSKPASIVARTITYTLEQQFALNLAEKMYQEHGIDHCPTVFRNRQNSYEQKVTGKCQIVFGYQDLGRCFENGFREYKSISSVWFDQGNLVGRRAIWALVLHEFTHVVQDVEGRLYSRIGHRNKIHNEQFVMILRELQTLYPYEEVANV